MQSDTTVDSSGRKSSRRRKFTDFFKCCRGRGSENDQKKDAESTASSKYDWPPRKPDDTGTVTETDQKGEGDQTTAGSESEKQDDSKREGPTEGRRNKERRRCRKCYKKKREKDSDRQRIDKRYCRCRRGGYCNTNTIVFPKGYKSNISNIKELQYLQLIKEIIKNETRMNPNELCEIRREIDRQREEIRELKTLLLQTILKKKTRENNKDNRVNYPGPENLVHRRSIDSFYSRASDSAKRTGSTSSRKRTVGKRHFGSEHSLILLTPDVMKSPDAISEFFPAETEKSISEDMKPEDTNTKPRKLWFRLFNKN